MKEILWFRRDLRISDSALLSKAKDEVLPVFIFDTNILEKLPKDDKRVTFIYKSVIKFKKELQGIGLDLAVFYGRPQEIFKELGRGFDRVLASCDFDSYALQRDKAIEKLIPMDRYYDSYLFHPDQALKQDNTPYRVFTPFYKSLNPLWQSDSIGEYQRNDLLRKTQFEYDSFPTLESMGFEEQPLPGFLNKSASTLVDEFALKLENYEHDRDYFTNDAVSRLSVHLRFGLISPRELFNKIKKYPGSEPFVRQIFWREFYNYILYHFPKSEHENFNGKIIKWEDNEGHFKAWCEGNTGVPIVDAAMRHLNRTGLMHNRLRMVVSSFLTKNLLIDWRKGEEYFSLKLLDYDASANTGSWQWAASTGADSVPYFRVFNPYLQSAKFDKEAVFIKQVIPALKDTDPKSIHTEYASGADLFTDYPSPIVDIKSSRNRAIEVFRNS
jgi:deoxyribodipyrimidine photo-lyase